MALIYGTDGIRQRNYRVWIAYPGSGEGQTGGETIYNDNASNLSQILNNINNYIENKQYASAYAELNNVLIGDNDIVEYTEKLGECRKDSITITCEDGDNVEGNEKGNIILNKSCSFSAELINAIPENIITLNSDVESQTPSYVILEEVSGRHKEWDSLTPEQPKISSDTHEIIFVGVHRPIIMSLTENHIGGGLSTVTLNANDNVSRINQFRAIFDIPYDLDNLAP